MPIDTDVSPGSEQDQTHEETLVLVQREWNSWRTGVVRLEDLEDVHWHQPLGAPRPLIHAFVRCDALVSGDVRRDCEETAGLDRLLVCLPKSRTAASVFEELARRADRRRVAEWPGARYSPEPLVTPLAVESARARHLLLRISMGAVAALVLIAGGAWLANAAQGHGRWASPDRHATD